MKALKLGLVDGAAAVGVSPVWRVPIVGPYVGLWLSFGASWAAADTGAKQAPVVTKSVKLNNIISLIVSTSVIDNPFSELGQKHNSALNDLASTQISMIEEDNKINKEVIEYMTVNSFMNTTLEERIEFVTDPINEEKIVANFKNYSDIKTIDGLKNQIISNENSTIRQKDFIVSISSFLEENSDSIDEIIITKYIDGLEEIIINNSTLNSKERDELLSFLSILNYSYCYWTEVY